MVEKGHKGIERVKKGQIFQVKKIFDLVKNFFHQSVKHCDKVAKASIPTTLSCQKRVITMLY